MVVSQKILAFVSLYRNRRVSKTIFVRLGIKNVGSFNINVYNLT